MLINNEWQRRFDGRFVIVAFLLLYFGLIIFYAYFIGDYTEFWYFKFGVPATRPLFLDLDVVASGCESFINHFDPLINNPYDSLNRPMNYPRVWLLLSNIGFSKTHTFWTGIALGVLFWVACLNYIGPIKFEDNRQQLLYVTIFCSPSIMLLVERGNIDVVIFLCMALCIKYRKQLIIYLSVLFLSVVLKLFPLVLFLLDIRRTLKKKVYLIMFFVFVVVYLFFIKDDLLLISNATPREVIYSYGKNVLFEGIINYYKIQSKGLFVTFLPVLTIVVLLVMCLAKASKANYIFKIQESEKFGFGFLVGSMIYLFTFIVGNNFDYRLAFLVLTIPAILVWTKQESGFGFYKILLICILLLIWNTAIRIYLDFLNIDIWLFCLEELASWLVFYAFMAINIGHFTTFKNVRTFNSLITN